MVLDLAITYRLHFPKLMYISGKFYKYFAIHLESLKDIRLFFRALQQFSLFSDLSIYRWQFSHFNFEFFQFLFELVSERFSYFPKYDWKRPVFSPCNWNGYLSWIKKHHFVHFGLLPQSNGLLGFIAFFLATISCFSVRMLDRFVSKFFHT